MSISDWFRPKWKHSNWEVRIEAVRKIADPNVLVDVFKHDEKRDVRKAALDSLLFRMTSESIASLARDADETWIQEAAIRHLGVRDQRLLGEIVKNSRTLELRRLAGGHVTDQKILGEIAKMDGLFCRRDDVARITDQAVLEDVAKNAKKTYITEEAVRRITNQGVLGDIARDTSSWAVRKAAVERISDPSLIARFGARYSINSERTVEDQMTGLIWQRTAPAELYTWADAMAYAEQMNILGLPGTGWRLPSIKELESIADEDMMKAFGQSQSGSYWSSTWFHKAGYVESQRFVKLIIFSPPWSHTEDATHNKHRVRCVRGSCPRLVN